MTSQYELCFAALEDALDTLALFQSMFPLDNELKVSSDTAAALPELEELLRVSQDDLRPACKISAPVASIIFTLSIFLDDLEVPQEQPLEFDVQLSITGEADRPPTLQLRQPGFLNRAQHLVLSDELAAFVSDQTRNSAWTSSDLLLASVDLLRESAGAAFKESQISQNEDVEEESEAVGELQRTWFWFPSLSSREKRQDFVDYSHEYKLTGFVMAGKPGLLCVEGNFPNADRFMSTIKSKSWSDIPSFQKKVTERLRSTITTRAFKSMTDITDMIPKHGTYAHRGDMSEVKRLMESWGVGDDFSSVVLGA